MNKALPSVREVLIAALNNPESHVECLPIAEGGHVEGRIFDRAHAKPGKRPAYLRVWCPEEWVPGTEQRVELRDHFYAIRVPLEFVQEMEREANSLIVKP